jgi:hypothetical protein
VERTLKIVAMVLLLASASRAAPPQPPPAVSAGKDGKLAYVTDENGDRVPDFSYAGYGGGGVKISDAVVAVVVPRLDGDNTARIQSAIDYAATLNTGDKVIRAVLLGKGRYEINGSLVIGNPNVVLRGSGAGVDGTTLVATGQDRRTLIRVEGQGDRVVNDHAIAIASRLVPVNSTRIKLAEVGNVKSGDTVLVRRACSAEWVKQLGMDNMGGERHSFTWKPGSRDIAWDRKVTAVEGETITLDAPITVVIDPKLGGGTVATYTHPGVVYNVGVENLRCESPFDEKNPKDEAHSWFAITINNASDVWVRQVTTSHFVASSVAVYETANRVTVEDCKSLAPVSEIAGQRRDAFFTSGQQVLFQRCYAEQARHAFSVGFCAAGPNAFVQCEAKDTLDDSGPIDSAASGVLYDNVRIDGNALNLYDRSYRSQGAGWSALNCVLWQSSASIINLFDPPGAKNWAFGCWGGFNGDGEWAGCRESVKPVSLYYGQLADRVGKKVLESADIMMVPSDASSSPPAEVAAKLIAASTQPGPQLSDWIDQAAIRNPIPTSAAGAKSVDDLPKPSGEEKHEKHATHPIAVRDGWIVADDAVVAGGRQDITWWAGGIRPNDLAAAKPSPTRFVPGRHGPGLTDDLNHVTDDMVAGNRAALEYHYGLWYDTRDADHERIRRMDGDVWPPFYEFPFARSGTGLAWDGLSKYDLTKYDPWYFARLKRFTTLADRKGLVLIHNQFFQHNILEAGAHWASCPWRTANNVNNTGFPEPPPYAGDKRIFMAEQFYDVNNATRTAIYRAYIRKCLDNFTENSNVIQLTSSEFTGPLRFMQFWLDTVAEWEKDTGKKAIIGLSATKDVQDAILADPVRSKLISVIDLKYWWYQPDGSAYAPPGGQNLSPRQWERVIKHKGTNFEQVARAVREYRLKYPDKAVICSGNGYDNTGWAQLMGGGSLAELDCLLAPELRAAIAKMKPIESDGKSANQWKLSDGGQNVLIYGDASAADTAGYAAHWIDGKSGKMTAVKSTSGPAIVWLSRK